MFGNWLAILKSRQFRSQRPTSVATGLRVEALEDRALMSVAALGVNPPGSEQAIESWSRPAQVGALLPAVQPGGERLSLTFAVIGGNDQDAVFIKEVDPRPADAVGKKISPVDFRPGAGVMQKVTPQQTEIGGYMWAPPAP